MKTKNKPIPKVVEPPLKFVDDNPILSEDDNFEGEIRSSRKKALKKELKIRNSTLPPKYFGYLTSEFNKGIKLQYIEIKKYVKEFLNSEDIEFYIDKFTHPRTPLLKEKEKKEDEDFFPLKQREGSKAMLERIGKVKRHYSVYIIVLHQDRLGNIDIFKKFVNYCYHRKINIHFVNDLGPGIDDDMNEIQNFFARRLNKRFILCDKVDNSDTEGRNIEIDETCEIEKILKENEQERKKINDMKKKKKEKKEEYEKEDIKEKEDNKEDNKEDIKEDNKEDISPNSMASRFASIRKSIERNSNYCEHHRSYSSCRSASPSPRWKKHKEILMEKKENIKNNFCMAKEYIKKILI